MNIGINIKELRKLKGLTQKELAHKTETTISYISKVERGEINPSLKILKKMAYVLEIPMSTFVDEEEIETKILNLYNEAMQKGGFTDTTNQFINDTVNNANTNPIIKLLYEINKTEFNSKYNINALLSNEEYTKEMFDTFTNIAKSYLRGF